VTVSGSPAPSSPAGLFSVWASGVSVPAVSPGFPAPGVPEALLQAARLNSITAASMSETSFFMTIDLLLKSTEVYLDKAAPSPSAELRGAALEIRDQ
jgi:hypothetical protein